MVMISTIICAVLHELGHAYKAHSRGYVMKKLVIMPFGAVLYGAENLQKKDAFAISLAGPLVNVLLIIGIYALWWIIPDSHIYTIDFMRANCAILFFNLLPIYPLDGGRAILALSKNTQKTLKILRCLGVIISCLMMGLFIVSAFYELNLSIGMLAIMLYISSTSSNKDSGYEHIANSATLAKDLHSPIKNEHYTISDNLMLLELLKLIKAHKIITVTVVNNLNLRSYATLSEKDIADLCLHCNLRTKLCDILKKG